METIELETRIAAPAMRVFLLSLSVDLHRASTADTSEEAIAGVTSGVMRLGDEVTWRATHFGLRLKHSVRISVCDAPRYFRDEMTRGLFSSFHHDHFFEGDGDGVTIMRDRLLFSAPFGSIGRLVERFALRGHLEDLLLGRNAFIKQVAETDLWRSFLEGRNR